MRGSVVIGTVEGDVHDIGKNLVKLMFEIAGFEVHDLGKDVPLDKFVDWVRRVKGERADDGGDGDNGPEQNEGLRH